MKTPQTPAAAAAERAAQAAFSTLDGEDFRAQWLLLTALSDSLQRQRHELIELVESTVTGPIRRTREFDSWAHRFDQFEQRAGWYHGFLGTFGDQVEDDELREQFESNVLEPLLFGGDPGVAAEPAINPDVGEAIRLRVELEGLLEHGGTVPPEPETPALWERMLSFAMQTLVDHVDVENPIEAELAGSVKDALARGEENAGHKYGSPWGKGDSFGPMFLAIGGIALAGLLLFGTVATGGRRRR